MTKEKALSEKRRTTAGGSWPLEDGEFLFKKDVAEAVERLKSKLEYSRASVKREVSYYIDEIFGDLK